MRLSFALTTAILTAAVSLCAQNQSQQTEAKGMPPRASASDYQAHTQAGAITLAAEFTGHSVPTMQGALSTEDYIVVEVGLFGAAGAHTTVSSGDFALRVNGKKSPLGSQPFGAVLASLKDPEWEPPTEPKSKSKTSLGGGGKSEGNEPPAPVQVPVSVQRAMGQRVQKAALPEGERTLPVAGLIFFQYRGKAQGIHSVELIYTGPAGKATLALRP